MTVVTEHPSPAASAPTGTAAGGPTLVRLIRGELLKVRTTNLWWILALCAGVGVILALVVNGGIAYFEIDSALNPPDFGAGAPPGQGPSPEELDRMEAEWLASHDLHAILVRHAANIFTSGQYFGLLILMLFGAMLVTGEYFNQTATTTFLGAPRRSLVIAAKVAAAIIVAAIVWFVTTLVNLGAGSAFFAVVGQSNSLDVFDVQRAVLMNLPAYALWALLGMGLGALLRNQIAATLVGAGLYLIVGQAVQLIFLAVYNLLIEEAWVIQSMIALPAVASSVMISPERVTLWFTEAGPIYAPPWWVGGLVLLGYGVVGTLVGTLFIRRRDIS